MEKVVSMPAHRKPVALKLLHGSRIRGKSGLKEVDFKGKPRCPRWLAPEAKIEWQRITGELAHLGMIKSTDQATLAAYCQSWARWHSAERIVSRDGQVLNEPEVSRSGHFTGRYKRKRHPAVEIARQEKADCAALGRLFGFDPTSRQRVHFPADIKPATTFDIIPDDGDLFSVN